jgi:L-amino acid N-acyltransferase YncA
MSLLVRHAVQEDQSWLIAYDDTVSHEWIQHCIDLRYYLVAERDQQPLGFLRFSWFWGKIPYIDMIYVERSHRRSGIGKQLLSTLQNHPPVRKASCLMTSCEAGEDEPLHWHKCNGFEVVGDIAIPTFQTAREIFLLKRLT